MDARSNVLLLIIIIVVAVTIFQPSDGVTRRGGLLTEFVDCFVLSEANGDATGPQDETQTMNPTETKRPGGIDYSENYYEENQATEWRSDNPGCLCSENFSEVRCQALMDRDGSSLFLPGSKYENLARFRGDLTWKETSKYLNKTSVDESFAFTSFHLEKNSINSILPRNTLQNMKFQRIVFNFNEVGRFLNHNLFSKETLESVEVLELGGCDLGSIPPRRLLRGSRKLRRLYLWGNRIKSFPSNFFSDSRSLLELVLCGNNISSIDESTFGGVDQLVNLKLLDLDKNGISTLQGIKLKDRFKESSDYSFPFDGKDRSSISRVIGTKLEVLKLGGNNIHTLPSGFLSDFKHLKFLKLDSNGLSYVYPGAFDGLRSLIRLCLAWNMIGYLPDDIFAQMSQLLVLELQGNRLEHLWFRTFRGLSSLQSLDLSRNRLSALAEGLFQHSASLIRIDLSHNQLQFLDECSFHRPIHRIQSVSLVDNPIVCSCALSWLWKLMKSSDLQIANISSFEEVSTGDDIQIRPSLHHSLRLDSGHHHHHHHQHPLHKHRYRHHRKIKRRNDYHYSTNYTDYYDQTNGDDYVTADSGRSPSEVPDHMKPYRNLITWGSCTLTSRDAHHQQLRRAKSIIATSSSSSSSSSPKHLKQLPISSLQVRVMFNCSTDRCDDEL